MEESEEVPLLSIRNRSCGDGGMIEKSSMVDFETNMFILINSVGGVRMTASYLYVCGIQEGDGGGYDTTGLRTTNLAKSKFVSVVNDQFAISKSQLKAILPDYIFEVDYRKELFVFQVV
ncbi:hypothetical protein AVEN_132103-1 [Araneus ventricosus]|uniref:Uncharacterized protein n=1 Tax=Araneus ventricosus TaxID=182803 RepID=A0A4Y2KTY9_ARAVE|nr:hypothetical protein AVEN_132103-1 [Araneus ventricosus]